MRRTFCVRICGRRAWGASISCPMGSQVPGNMRPENRTQKGWQWAWEPRPQNSGGDEGGMGEKQAETSGRVQASDASEQRPQKRVWQSLLLIDGRILDSYQDISSTLSNGYECEYNPKRKHNSRCTLEYEIPWINLCACSDVASMKTSWHRFTSMCVYDLLHLR